MVICLFNPVIQQIFIEFATWARHCIRNCSVILNTLQGSLPSLAYSLLRYINKYTVIKTQPRSLSEAQDARGDMLL